MCSQYLASQVVLVVKNPPVNTGYIRDLALNPGFWIVQSPPSPSAWSIVRILRLLHLIRTVVPTPIHRLYFPNKESVLSRLEQGSKWLRVIITRVSEQVWVAMCLRVVCPTSGHTELSQVLVKSFLTPSPSGEWSSTCPPGQSSLGSLAAVLGVLSPLPGGQESAKGGCTLMAKKSGYLIGCSRRSRTLQLTKKRKQTQADDTEC